MTVEASSAAHRNRLALLRTCRCRPAVRLEVETVADRPDDQLVGLLGEQLGEPVQDDLAVAGLPQGAGQPRRLGGQHRVQPYICSSS